jgi:tetratricopeptide (TPR) repeat protein
MSDPTLKKKFNQAVQLASQGKLLESIQLYREILGKDPSFVKAWLNLGTLLYKEGKSAEAVKALKSALKLEKGIVEAHLLLAQIFREEGQEKQTEIYLTNTVKLDPKNKLALGALSVFYYDKGLYSESLRMVDQYLNHYPDDKNLKILRTDLLAKQGNYKASLSELTELVKKDAGFASFQASIQSNLRAGDSEIKQHVENLAKKTKDKIHEFKAKLELSKENPEDFSPPEPQDALDLSLLYLFQGDSEKAMKYLVYAKKANEENKK